MSEHWKPEADHSSSNVQQTPPVEPKRYWAGFLAGTAVMALISAIPGITYFVPTLLLFGLAMYIIAPLAASIIACQTAAKLGMTVGPEMVGMTLLGLCIGTFGIILMGLDGMICVLMAMPLAMIICIVGSYQYIREEGINGIAFALMGTLAVGGDMHRIANEPALIMETRIHVAAPPEEVWPLVIEQPDLSGSKVDKFVAITGAAHPLSTHCPSAAVGARRVCRLTTGDMHEEVTESVPNRRFAFRVLNTPPAMKETNPFHPHIHPGHLDGYIEMRRGSFDLIETESGTEIIARSTYINRYGPIAYWRLWSDRIVRGVHNQVLDDVKRRAE